MLKKASVASLTISSRASHILGGCFMATNTFSRGAAFLVLVCCGFILLMPGPTSLSANELENLWGGDAGCQPVANNCITTTTSCPDPVYASCSRVGTTNTCQKCFLNVPNYSICKSINDPTKSCCLHYLATNPYCGIYKTTTWDGMSCLDPCATATKNACGVQIPDTIGLACP